MANLNEELASARLIEEQFASVGEGVKRWQAEKSELETKIAGVESFQKLILDQPDDVILEFIKDMRQQLRNQGG